MKPLSRFALLSATIVFAGFIVGLLLPTPPASESISINTQSRPKFIRLSVHNLSVGVRMAFPPLGVSMLFLNGLALCRQILLFQNQGYELAVLTAAVLPHAVIEFSGFCFAAGIGFAFFYRIAAYTYGSIDTIVSRNFKRSILATMLTSVGLILIGALVEAYITPQIVSMVTT